MSDKRLGAAKGAPKKTTSAAAPPAAPEVSADQGETFAAERGVNREPDEARSNRAMEDRAVSENRELTEEDRLQMFQAQMYKEILPDLPIIPGYHVCWLTTNNLSDPIARRLRLGYVLITEEDIPGFQHATLKTGEYAGCIGVNEMIAAKLPDRLYQLYMRESHYDAPNREQEKLTTQLDTLKEGARSAGGEVIEFDGMETLRDRAPRAPKFQG